MDASQAASFVDVRTVHVDLVHDFVRRKDRLGFPRGDEGAGMLHPGVASGLLVSSSDLSKLVQSRTGITFARIPPSTDTGMMSLGIFPAG
jgi:hypothetical protein